MKGFTIIESLIGIAIIAIVATMFVSVFGIFRQSSDLTEAHSTIIGILQDARSRTLASESNSIYGVHFEQTQTVLFRGGTYDSSATSNEPYRLPTTVTISAISLGGPSDVVFTRLIGTTTASGTITLQSIADSTATRTVTIFSTGVVK